MSTDNIIELKNVGVTYRQRHSFFRHTSFEALHDVSFTVQKGETLGIIGLNGCGKSTLLKVLSSVYHPDQGEVIWHCKSVSLLSLGLGFDPQLSGRDNAVILGMFLGAEKHEVQKKLDEIVEFSGLGSFAVEPMKTYSSGMRARLGFSVAVKMHADLLLIDETLSVGDAQFKKKAEAAMIDKIRSNQSVVLVSHAMGQIRRLCNRVLWLDNGTTKMMDEPAVVIKEYENSLGLQK